MCREKKQGKEIHQNVNNAFFLTSDMICFFVLPCLLIFFLQLTHSTFMMKTNQPTRDIIYRLGGRKSQFPATLKLSIAHTQIQLFCEISLCLEQRARGDLCSQNVWADVSLEQWGGERDVETGITGQPWNVLSHTRRGYVPPNECSNCHSLIQLSWTGKRGTTGGSQKLISYSMAHLCLSPA